MSDNIQILHDDHRNFARTMRLLERCMQNPDCDDDPDYALMHDLMMYMTHYPDVVHHAREDLIFLRLLELDDELREVVEQQLAEHREIANRGQALVSSLNQVLSGEVISREELDEALLSYISLEREHMRREEAKLLPLAAQLMNSDDWDEVDRQLALRPDPLFGPSVQNQFQHLLLHLRSI